MRLMRSQLRFMRSYKALFKLNSALRQDRMKRNCERIKRHRGRPEVLRQEGHRPERRCGRQYGGYVVAYRS